MVVQSPHLLVLVELLFPDVLYKLWAKFLVTAADQNFKNRTHTTHNTVHTYEGCDSIGRLHRADDREPEEYTII